MKSQTPLVSFIIPTLNAERFLERCLKAIRQQDYPKDKIEIIVADAGSSDNSRTIAEKYGAKVIDNPEILHEPGKTLATKSATGEIIFYTDADNILADKDWLSAMVRPYLSEKKVLGLLPQTSPPPDSSGLNRYLSYLFTDPLTWFIYGYAANPAEYDRVYRPIASQPGYKLYRFTLDNPPLFGLSQGVGAAASFRRGGRGRADDLLAGLQIIEQGGLIAYVPAAKLYHYHVDKLGDFGRKYRWRIRNNLQQKVEQMGLVNRLSYFSLQRKLRLLLFLPYALTLVGPAIDALRLWRRWKDPVMLWHLPATFYLATIIASEYLAHFLGRRRSLGAYG